MRMRHKSFASKNMTDMVRILKDVIKPGAHEHVFSSALRFALMQMTLGLDRTEA